MLKINFKQAWAYLGKVPSCDAVSSTLVPNRRCVGGCTKHFFSNFFMNVDFSLNPRRVKNKTIRNCPVCINVSSIQQGTWTELCCINVGYGSFVTLAPLITTVTVLYFGGHLVLQGTLKPGDLVSFVFYQQSLSQAINSMGDVFTGLMQAAGAADKVFLIVRLFSSRVFRFHYVRIHFFCGARPCMCMHLLDASKP